MSEYTEKIAKVVSTHLGFEDHGYYTCNINFDYGDSGHQGTGHIILSRYSKKLKKNMGTAGGMTLLIRIMEACGVDEWNHLIGRRVPDGMVKGIQPLPTDKGKTLIFKDLDQDLIDHYGRRIKVEPHLECPNKGCKAKTQHTPCSILDRFDFDDFINRRLEIEYSDLKIELPIEVEWLWNDNCFKWRPVGVEINNG